MKRILLSLGIVTVLIAGASLAKPIQKDVGPGLQNEPVTQVILPNHMAKTVVDTTYLLGGPDRWDGSFETPSGQPDWHGWTSEDVSFTPGNHWHVSTYMADQIAGHGPGNHAMYCGDETIAACDPPDTIGGYGNGWLNELEWTEAVSDPSQPVTVRLTGAMNYDTEDGYDWVHLLVQKGDEFETLESWSGLGSAALDFSTTMLPLDFIGNGADEVRLVWRFYSDGSWSDEDCLFPTRGACQIDDLTVTFDEVPITFDDFEPGNPVNWYLSELPFVGDFTSLRNNLNSVHSCQSVNPSYQVNFVDDGIVVPGTGGTPCIDWCYGPDGWILNHDGGLMADTPYVARLINQAVSPPLTWPGDLDGAHLSFDLYIHEPFNASSSGMFAFWGVRSTASSDPADLENAPWMDRNFLMENNVGKYRRLEEPVSDLLVPNRLWVQIALGVNEFGPFHGIDGPNGTPSPYFDNVAFKVWDPVGPDIEVRKGNLFGDAFPEAGTLDPVDLATNWCRIDMASLNFQQERGDTLVAYITPLRHGATVVEPPYLHWTMKCNPVFDDVRPSAPGPEGLLRGMVPGGVAVVFDQPYPGRWAFDLPDTGFFFPGDRLQYYITASDDLDGDIRTSVWPADTTGVLDFSADSLYPYQARINGLPSVTQPSPGTFEHPAILLIDDSQTNPDSRSLWLEALQDLGLALETDVEIFTIFSPYDLGKYLNAGLLDGYHTLLYSAGSAFPSMDEEGPSIILEWLDTGGKMGLFAGENLVSQLTINNESEGYILKPRLGVSFSNGTVTRLNGGIWDLQMNPVPGNGVLPDGLTWQVDAVCSQIRFIDAIGTASDGQSASTLDPVGQPGGPFSAVVTVNDPVLGNRTAVVSFDLDAITDMTVGAGKSDKNFSPSTYLAYFLMSWLGADVISGADDVPGIGQLAVSAHPNPFNPQTTIAFDLPRAMEVSLDIYDLQGRLVRRLLDESPHAACGHKQVWDGRNNEGGLTASGVYFYRFTAGDKKRVGKLTLLK